MLNRWLFEIFGVEGAGVRVEAHVFDLLLGDALCFGGVKRTDEHAGDFIVDADADDGGDAAMAEAFDHDFRYAHFD